MNFTPKSKTELDAANLFPKGEYDIDIYDAEEKPSSKGNPMLVLKMKVYAGASERFFTDYIVTNNDLGLAKLYTLCDATGQLDRYEAGSVNADDFSGKCCKAVFSQQKDKQSGELRNNLQRYVSGTLQTNGPDDEPY